MSTRDIPSTDITQRAIIARAAQLAAYYQDDLDRESLAREQLETLAAFDFSAMNTGREIANEMIVGGYAETLESFYSLMPLDLAGLTFGAASKSAEKALNNLWGEILSKHISNELPCAERRTLVNDLSVALVGYGGTLLENANSISQRHSGWRSFIQLLCPQSLSLGINVPFIQIGGTWRIWRDRS